MNFDINWKGNNAIIKMDGTVGFVEINMMNGKLYGDSRFEKMNYQLFDLSDVDKFTLNARDFEMIGVLDRNSSVWNRSMKVAVVFKNEEMIKLMDHYINAMKDTEWKVKVFRNFEEAQKWCTTVE